MSRKAGFTLIEVVLSILILGLSAVTISEIYFTGFNAMDNRILEGQVDSAMRSRMERLLAQKFAVIMGGSEAVTIEGQAYTITWTVNNVDLDGDTMPETAAKQLTVTLAGKSLTTIVVDSAGLVKKI
jgi:prepilin-type N-terminal cleavage/methylation domain-containing protein